MLHIIQDPSLVAYTALGFTLIQGDSRNTPVPDWRKKKLLAALSFLETHRLRSSIGDHLCRLLVVAGFKRWIWVRDSRTQTEPSNSLRGMSKLGLYAVSNRSRAVRVMSVAAG